MVSEWKKLVFVYFLKGRKLLELVPGILYTREPIICVEKISFILHFIVVIFLGVHYNIFVMFCPRPLVFFWMYKHTHFSLHQSKDKAFPEKYHVVRKHSTQAGVCEWSFHSHEMLKHRTITHKKRIVAWTHNSPQYVFKVHCVNI